MTMRALLIAIAACLGGWLHAQIRVDRPLELQGPSPADRQVTGLEVTSTPGAALTAGMEQSAAYRTASPSVPGTWVYSVPSLNVVPAQGLQLLVIPPAVSVAGAITITVNGHGPYALTRGPGRPVDGSEITGSGAVLSVVYDGTDFQLMNGTGRQPRPCPAGTVALSTETCVATSALPGGVHTFFQAIDSCAVQGMRLCSWAEWVSACVNQAQLGTTGFGPWEWTNDAANEDNYVRQVRGTAPGCNGVATASSITAALMARCCYSR